MTDDEPTIGHMQDAIRAAIRAAIDAARQRPADAVAPDPERRRRDRELLRTAAGTRVPILIEGDPITGPDGELIAMTKNTAGIVMIPTVLEDTDD